jgi:MipA family protein
MSSHRPPALPSQPPGRSTAAATHAAPPAPRVALVLCSLLHGASAQQPGSGSAEASSWGLGLALTSTQQPYAGIDREHRLLPLVLFENRYVRVRGPGVELKLPSLGLGGTDRIEFSLLGRYDGSGYEADDAPILAGMDKRRGGLWAGAKAEWKNELVDVSAEWTADAASHSKGQQFSLGLQKSWRLGGQLMLTPRLGVKWQDSKYVDYYYGVRSSEALAGRAAYAGESGLNTELGVRAMLRLDAHQSLMFDLGVTSLAKGIKNSPLVDRSSENRVLLGYLYRY